MIRRAIEGRLREWGEPIEALLREGFRRRTLILDITEAPVVPDINDNDIYMQEFGRFIRLLMAVRESMRCGGRWRIRILGPCDEEILRGGVGMGVGECRMEWSCCHL